MAPLRLSVAAVAVVTISTAAFAQNDELAKCEKPFGILAVNEPQQQYMQIFQRYQLGSPAALLRMMAQNSKCFVVVERGLGMQNIQQDRALAASSEMLQDANMGKGQMKAADFVMTAAVQVSDPNAGGVGGAVGGRREGKDGDRVARRSRRASRGFPERRQRPYRDSRDTQCEKARCNPPPRAARQPPIMSA